MFLKRVSLSERGNRISQKETEKNRRLSEETCFSEGVWVGGVREERSREGETEEWGWL